MFDSWEEIKCAEKIDGLKEGLLKHGLQVISLQSVLFNKPTLELFATNEIREHLSVHTKGVIDLASHLGARIIVWGSPKQRQTHGRAYEECFTIACDWFREIGEYSQQKGVTIGIEANAKEYGCDFCYTTDQAAELVRAVDHLGVRLHLDTGNMHMAGDDIQTCVNNHKDIICHVQVSEPNLGTFHSPVVNHAAMAALLSQVGYSGFISIEMRDSGGSVQAVAQALNFVKKVYRNVLT